VNHTVSEYCFTGSARIPDITGDIRKPHPHIPITIFIVRDSTLTSLEYKSETIVLIVATIPLEHPRKNLKIIAPVKLFVIPNKRLNNAESSNELYRAYRRP
jgi:hypothetical protein